MGYDRVVMDANEAARLFGEGTSLPVITNNEKTVSGDQIRPYIRELERLMQEWQRFQGDFCYVDDGETC
ncbi:MAG: hypothetical protein L6Q26_06475 [Anaerolineales bacterium]|nr:hypothetical protein [Anaerolineales bacterium]